MRAFLIVILCSSTIAAADPSREIDGVVTSAETGRPLEGATVMTEQGDIAVTDHDGYFKIAVTEAQHALSVDLAGYASQNVTLAGEHLQVALAPAASASDEVIEVKAKAPSQTKPLSYKLTPEEITSLPGAGNDALRAAQILPGAARIPFGFGGLVLRGAAPADSQVYLDGIEVPLAFHFGGMTSFIPSRMLSDLSLTAGGFDTEYGRAQGGVVNLTTREPRTDHWRVGGAMGVLDSSVTAEGPVAHGGVLIGLRHSYFDVVADPFVGNDIPLPSYWDAQIKGSFGDPAKLGRITPMLILSIDHIANHPSSGEDVSRLAITSMFVRGSISYLKQWGPLTLHVQPWAGTNRLSFTRVKDGQTQTLERPEYPAGLRADLTRDTSWGHVRGGIDASSGYLSRSQVGFTGENGPVETTGSRTVAWGDLALWGETRLKLAGDRFSIKPGLRLERYGLTNEVVLDPRLDIQQKLADGITLREALGRFHQPPAPGDVDPDNGNPNLKSSYFDQASLGVDADVAEGVSTSLTGFYHYGHDLGVQTPSGPSDTMTPDLGGLGATFDLLLQRQLGFPVHRMNIGRARSYGVEVMVKAHVERYFGMLGYTLSKSERTDDPTTMLGWRPFELDQRHDLNAAGSVDLGSGWRVGAHLRLVSGNPYTPMTMVDGSPVQRPWAAILPTFFQLDLRADKRWHRDWGDVNLFLDVQNVTNRRNIEGIDFDSQGTATTTPGLPVMPFLGVEYIPR